MQMTPGSVAREVQSRDMLFQDACNRSNIELALCCINGQANHFSLLHAERVAVELIEDNQCQYCCSFVSIDEWMITTQGMKQSAGFGVNIWIGFLAENRLLWAHNCGLEKPEIPEEIWADLAFVDRCHLGDTDVPQLEIL